MVIGYEVIGDETLGDGGFLTLRRLRLRARLAGGALTAEGLYDFVERPPGLDAVVLAIWRRGADGRPQVLLRDSMRIPLVFGRGEARPEPFTEVVAGILEVGDDVLACAAAEAHEEAGLTVSPADVEPLGPAMFPTPGMCAELFHLLSCEVRPDAAAVAPPGDGSPFEEGARVRWVPLADALGACARGEIRDMKTELILRRLAEKVGG